MKRTKKFALVLLAVIALSAFVVPVAFAQGETPVQLPDKLVGLISIGVIYLVTEGLKALGSVFKVDISGGGSVIAAALTTAVVAFLNGWLALVPAAWAPVANQILTLIVLLLGAGGFWRLFRK